MKRALLLVIFVGISVLASAQLKSIRIEHQTDTLIVNTSNSSLGEDLAIDLFKGPQGYLFKLLITNHFHSTSQNPNLCDNITFFNNPSFYIGDTSQEAILTLKDLLKLCENDIATQADIQDFKGNIFHVLSASGVHLARSRMYIESDRLLVWNDKMENPMVLLKKTITDAMKYLER